MSPVTHLLVSWAVANSANLRRRERAAVTLAGILPDADGIGVVAEVATRGSANPLTWYSDYHHVLAHNLGFALLVAGVCAGLARGRRLLTAGLALVAFHLHLVGDLVGSKGPDGSQWAIHYLWPLDAAGLTVTWQWRLDAWPNLLVTVLMLALTFYLAWRRGFSPVGLLSQRADQAFVQALRQRFGAARVAD